MTINGVTDVAPRKDKDMKRIITKTFEELEIDLSKDAPQELIIDNMPWKIAGTFQVAGEILYEIDYELIANTQSTRIAELEAEVARTKEITDLIFRNTSDSAFENSSDDCLQDLFLSLDDSEYVKCPGCNDYRFFEGSKCQHCLDWDVKYKASQDD